MNTYNFGISGEWWLLMLGILIGLFIAIFVYKRTLPPISSKRKAWLIAFRTTALALLIFILFEPLITRISATEEAPKVYVLLDNSISTGIKDAKGDRSSLFQQSIENTNFISLDKEQLSINLFSESLTELGEFNPDTINHSGQISNISNAIRQTINNSKESNIQAALLITDGSFNEGDNPIYAADDFAKPIFIVGIGDTTQPKDVSVQFILTNEIAYLDNPIPVNVNIKKSIYSEGIIKVSFFDNGKKVSEQEIHLTPEKDEYSLVFEYIPKTEGIRKLTFRASVFEDEITSKNNIRSEFVRVLKNKRRIAIFAGSPCPDLSFIGNELNDEKGVEIKTYIQKQGAEFYNQMPNPSELNEAEMIIFVGFPVSSTPQKVMEMVKNELKRGKPFLFIMSNEVDYRKLNVINDYLPFTVMSTRKNEFLISLDVKPEALSNPLLRVFGELDDMLLWNKLPPVFRNETFFKPKPESEVVATIKVNNMAINEPFILMRSFQNNKSVAVLAYSLFRWKLLGYAQDQALGYTNKPDLFSIFFGNVFRWLSISTKDKNIIIKTSKTNYTSDEKIEFFAQVYDAAYTPVDNAEVKITITGGDAESQILLKPFGNGRYKEEIESLPEADYFFDGIVTLNGNKLGKDNGRFSVGEIPLEYSDLTMNANLLRNIANRTGGKFYLPENSGQFLEDLKSLKDFRPKPVVKRSEFVLWNWYWLLVLAILCFASEWFLRKKWGMI